VFVRALVPFVIHIATMGLHVDSVPFVGGLRLLTINVNKLADDPTFSLWLFIDVTQVQIFASLISATYPALKQILLDPATHYGNVSEGSKSRSQDSEALPSDPYAEDRI